MSAIVNGTTGKIEATTQRFVSSQENCPQGFFVTDEECFDDIHYFVFTNTGPELTVRPRLVENDEIQLVADGIESLVIDVVPAGTRMWLRNRTLGELTIYDFKEDEEFVLASAEPTEYFLEIVVPESSFPLCNQNVTVSING